MTLANTTVKQRYPGDGLQTTFAIPFDFQNNSEIKVLLRDENVNPATETVLTISTHYTLTGSPATDVEMITAPIVGEYLLVYRVTPNTQATDYIETGTFPATAHENALDKLTQEVQENAEQIGRAFKFPISEDISALDLAFPSPTADYILGWNATGDAIESKDPASLTLIGIGDVIGPGAATDNAFARFDSVTGKLIQNSVVIASDVGVVSGITQLNVDNIRVDGNSITSTNLNGDINVTPSGTGNLVLDGLKWPQADGAGGTFLTTNGTGQLSFSAGAAGNVTGPGLSADNAIARFNGVDGKTIQNSGILIDDSDQITGVVQLSVGNLRLDTNQLISTNANGSINLTPNGTGDVVLDGVKWPQLDGAAGQALHTTGAGQAYWDTALTGDVVGPAVAVDNEIPRYDGITGKLVQGSGVIISDLAVLTGLDSAFIGELELTNSYIKPSTPGDDLQLVTNGVGSNIVLDYIDWPKVDGVMGQVLTTDGAGVSSWTTPAGGGDVLGPGASTDNAVVRWDLATGTAIQDSVVIIDDVGVVTGVTQLDVDNIRVDGNSIISTDVNGDLILTPNGTGDLVLDGLNWPQADGAAGQTLTTDGLGQLSWSAAGAGDVVGPAGATDEALVRFDGVTGKLVQNSVGLLTDAGAMSGLTQLDVDNLRLDGNTLSSTDVNGNINLTPNGTGDVVLVGVTVSDTNTVSGVTQLDVDNIRIDGNTIISTDAAGNINITPDTTGDLVLDGVKWPQADGAANAFLQTDGAGQTSWVAGNAGDVVGPAGATDNALARYDGATGKLLQDSLIIADDVGAVSGITQLDVDNIRIDGNSITSTDAAGNINITPDTTGDLVLDGLKWPQVDGTANQVIETDGAGQLSWVDAGGGGGLTVVEHVADATMTANTINITNSASRIVLTLPATSAQGDRFIVIGKGSGGWQVAQQAGQTVYRSGSNSITGTDGATVSGDANDSVSLATITANTDFGIYASEGSLAFSGGVGYWMGGSYETSAAGIQTDMSRFILSTVTASTSASTLTTKRAAAAGASGKGVGAIAGGTTDYGSGRLSDIEKITYSTDLTSVQTSALSVAKLDVGGGESSTDGYFYGGNEGAPASSADYRKHNIASDTAATITGTLVQDYRECGGAVTNGAATNMYSFPGRDGAGGTYDEIDKCVFATETVSQIADVLSGQAYKSGSGYSSTKGYWMHMIDSPDANTNYIEDLTFATEVSNTLSATMPVSKSNGKGVFDASTTYVSTATDIASGDPNGAGDNSVYSLNHGTETTSTEATTTIADRTQCAACTSNFL